MDPLSILFLVIAAASGVGTFLSFKKNSELKKQIAEKEDIDEEEAISRASAKAKEIILLLSDIKQEEIDRRFFSRNIRAAIKLISNNYTSQEISIMGMWLKKNKKYYWGLETIFKKLEHKRKEKSGEYSKNRAALKELKRKLNFDFCTPQQRSKIQEEISRV